MVKEIVKHVWNTKLKVVKKGIGENVFRFVFKLQVDKKLVFNGRPWTMNGSYLVLKKSSKELHMEEIYFNNSTIIV